MVCSALFSRFWGAHGVAGFMGLLLARAIRADLNSGKLKFRGLLIRIDWNFLICGSGYFGVQLY